MKRKISLKIVMLALFAALCAPLPAKDVPLEGLIKSAAKKFAAALDGKAKVVAVVDVRSDSEPLSAYIVGELNHRLAVSLKKTVVAERGERSAELLRKELDFQYSGDVDEATAQSLGRTLGADCLVYGAVEGISTGYLLTLKAVRLETKGVLVSWQGKIAADDEELNYQMAGGDVGSENPVYIDFPDAEDVAGASYSSLKCADLFDVFLDKLEENGTKNVSLDYKVYDDPGLQNLPWLVCAEGGKRGCTVLSMGNGYLCARNHPKAGASTARKDELYWPLVQTLCQFIDDSAESMRANGARPTKDELSFFGKFLADMVSASCLDGLDFLLESGVPVNLKSEFGYTALLAAAEEGLATVAEKLIGRRARLEERNDDGETALIIAARLGHADVAEVLIKAGANVGARNGDGYTALENAIEAGNDDVAALLRKAGARK